MQALNEGLQVLLELVVVVSLAVWGWEEGGGSGRWLLAFGVPLAFAIVWVTLVTRHSASKLDDPARLRLEIAMFICAAVALVRIGHPVLSFAFVLLAATQLTLTYALHQR